MADAAAFYVTTPIVLVAAAVPAVIRTYQLFSGNGSGWLELLVEALRVVLVAVMISAGRAGVGVTGSAWVGLRRDVVHGYRAGWLSILVQLIVVTVVAMTFNFIVESFIIPAAARGVVITLPITATYGDQIALATTFAVKNFVVIPIYLASILMASKAIHRNIAIT